MKCSSSRRYEKNLKISGRGLIDSANLLKTSKSESMKCTFLGTGTSMGVPVAGGFGSENINGDPRNQRYRCSIWIKTDDTSLIVDTGPEFRLQTIRSNIKRVDAVLITHEHMDHIAGLD